MMRAEARLLLRAEAARLSSGAGPAQLPPPGSRQMEEIEAIVARHMMQTEAMLLNAPGAPPLPTPPRSRRRRPLERTRRFYGPIQEQLFAPPRRPHRTRQLRLPEGTDRLMPPTDQEPLALPSMVDDVPFSTSAPRTMPSSHEPFPVRGLEPPRESTRMRQAFIPGRAWRQRITAEAEAQEAAEWGQIIDDAGSLTYEARPGQSPHPLPPPQMTALPRRQPRLQQWPLPGFASQQRYLSQNEAESADEWAEIVDNVEATIREHTLARYDTNGHLGNTAPSTSGAGPSNRRALASPPNSGPPSSPAVGIPRGTTRLSFT